jgi:hypothetical protein
LQAYNKALGLFKIKIQKSWWLAWNWGKVAVTFIGRMLTRIVNAVMFLTIGSRKISYYL